MSDVQIKNRELGNGSENILSQRIKVSGLRWLGVAYGAHVYHAVHYFSFLSHSGKIRVTVDR